MDREFKRAKKSSVQLTSLLDLLFVMIFVSLLQQKDITPIPPAKKAKVVKKKIKPKSAKSEKIIHSLEAIFHFYSVQGQQYSGKYQMEGTFNKKSGRLNLGSVKWIEKPPFDIVMVPLSGNVSKDLTSFTGKVEAKGCKEFNLKRTSIQAKGPVSGQWKGTYTCAQGSTGLTLTIK